MTEQIFGRSPVRRVPRGNVVEGIRGARLERSRLIVELARNRARHHSSRRRGRRERRWRFDPDAVFAFAIFTAMLFAPMAGTIGAVIFTALAILYILARLPHLAEIFAPRAFILLIPLIAVVSTLWSDSPVDSLKYSLEFALTIGIALIMSAAPRPKAVLWAICLAFGIYVVASVTAGQTVAVGNEGEIAFSGLGDRKNEMADIAACGFLVSLPCFVVAFERRRPFAALIALAVFFAAAYAVIEARSAGAVLGIIAATACFIFFLALRLAPLAIRIIMSTLVVVSAAVFALFDGSLVVADTLSIFEKDPTLTGRTYLWQRAGDFVAQNPLLGEGYAAFWLQGNLDAEGLWKYAGVISRSGFNFHNTAIEILVALGWLGLVVLSLTTLAASIVLLRRMIGRPDALICFWMCFLVYEFVRMPIESLGTAPFSYATVLMFAAFGSAMPAWQLARSSRRGWARRRVRFRTGQFSPSVHAAAE